MSREVQVRFCERLRVKFPLPTRLRTVAVNQKITNPASEKKSDFKTELENQSKL